MIIFEKLKFIPFSPLQTNSLRVRPIRFSFAIFFSLSLNDFLLGAVYFNEST